ncbi:hypothetical protein CBS14141_002417 [Malassezia furfur]|nr:hypothetical protein CBS14141_002417 [Malassezia furfur]
MSTAAEERVRAEFLNRQVRIRLRDQPRILQGMLVCVDREGNAILNEVMERRCDATPTDTSTPSERFVPMVMIPGEWIAQLSVLAEPAVDAVAQKEEQRQYLQDSMYF